MRVVSLVPSWTETLVECGVEVVGRTRYCVHPAAVKGIPVVGGTKDLSLSAVEALKPDLLLVDKEENLPWMAEGRGWKTHVTHVGTASDLRGELNRLGSLLGNEKLIALAEEWEQELARPYADGRRVSQMPGVLEWIREPTSEPAQLLYLIWREPWMVVDRATFAGSLLTHLGYGSLLPGFPVRYPKLDLSTFDPDRTLLLFSSEPYPFGRKRAEIRELGFPAALVDGEAYSWFGIRSLRFLQRSRADSP